MAKQLSSRVIDALPTTGKRYKVHDSKCTGLILRVEPSGKKVFFWRYRSPAGQDCWHRIGDHPFVTVQAARAEAEGYRLGLRNGILPGGRPMPRDGAVTLRGVVENYPDIARRRDPHRKPDAIARVVQRVEVHFAKWLDMPVDTLNAAMIAYYREVRQEKHNKKGKPISVATINRDIATLKSMLAAAAVDPVFKGVDVNPLAAVKVSTARERPGWGERGAHRYLRPHELEALLSDLSPPPGAGDFARRNKLVLRARVVICLYAGLRVGECDRLEWRDLDLQARVLTVRAESAKTGRVRHIPMHWGIVWALSDLLHDGVQAQPGGLVFPPESWQKGFRLACKRAGIEDLRRYDLRHHFGSMLAMAGAEAHEIAASLGHEGIQTSMRYVKFGTEARRERIDSL